MDCPDGMGAELVAAAQLPLLAAPLVFGKLTGAVLCTAPAVLGRALALDATADPILGITADACWRCCSCSGGVYAAS